jgi:VCBS repeat protein/aldos-2-ulose dehydratase/isomerase family protein
MPWRLLATAALLIFCTGIAAANELVPPRFRAVEIDGHIEIGYGVAVADVDGDRKPDILLADKKQIVWYRNPNWDKFVIAANLTTLDNVCITAADIDGDGKAEVAVGAGWNPSDTVNSGAVFYLIPAEDRTKKWEPVELPHEPTVHRMRWIRNGAGEFELVVVPLHGRDNQNAAGAGVRILSYKKSGDRRGTWKTELINDSLHATHNFEPVRWTGQSGTELLVASKEGVFHVVPTGTEWQSHQLSGVASESGAGEVRAGRLPGGKRFVATIEAMHGNQLVVYTQPANSDSKDLWTRHLIDGSLKEGHALACGDLMRAGFDQIVVGWRGRNNEGKVGVKLSWPTDTEGEKWREATVDDNTVACEDLCLADVNGDGWLDIVVAGRATRNLKVFFNETAK